MFKNLFNFSKDKKNKGKKDSEVTESVGELEEVSLGENTIKKENILEEEKTLESSKHINEDENLRDSAIEVKEPDAEENKGFFSNFLSGLTKTRENISGKIDSVIGSFTKIDEELFEMLEDTLIMADIGAETTMEISDRLRQRVKNKRITDPHLVKGELNELLKEMLIELGLNNTIELENSPMIILVIGVNGVGKTTSIGKLTNKFKKQGKSVILGAADTFRAAAIDQLGIWADRAGVEMISHKEGSDPGAVVFDTISAAKARDIDIAICDTAGRLHNKKNLMNELNKIYRIISEQYKDAHVETLLVLDATTGQNALNQAKEFNEATDITGIILTKMDGTAKGGVVLRLQKEMGIPVKYIGLGEGIDDLMDFDIDYFVDSIVS